MRELALVVAVVIAIGCRPERKGVTVHAARDAGVCAPRTAEKLGIPFVRVCPSDLPNLGVAFEPFWIAAAPVGCSAGSHTTIPCPSVIAIAHADIELRSRLAAMVDLQTANRLCAMRFAGRLPTRMERILAREALGASTLAVLRDGTTPTRDEVREVAEWVTERPWDQPTTIDGSAAPGFFPREGRAAIGTHRNVACGAKLVTAPGIDIGETCLGDDCVVRSEAAVPSSFRLTCAETSEPPVPAPSTDGAELAAFRCVVPDKALVLDGGI